MSVTCKFGEIESDEVGLADYALESIATSCKFSPANFTKSQAEALIGLQGSTALIPGQKIGVKGQALVLASDAVRVTLANMGAKDYKELFQTSKDRIGEITFVNSVSTTAGLADALITFEDLT